MNRLVITDTHENLDWMGPIFQALSFVDGIDFHDILWWRCEQGKFKWFINCSDMFYWATADCEEILPGDIPSFIETIEDTLALSDEYAYCHAPELWVSRKRGMRPQGAYYKHFTPELARLFDACGPERKNRLWES